MNTVAHSSLRATLPEILTRSLRPYPPPPRICSISCKPSLWPATCLRVRPKARIRRESLTSCPGGIQTHGRERPSLRSSVFVANRRPAASRRLSGRLPASRADPLRAPGRSAAAYHREERSCYTGRRGGNRDGTRCRQSPSKRRSRNLFGDQQTASGVEGAQGVIGVQAHV